MAFLSKWVPENRTLRVGIDGSNGMAGLFIRKLLGTDNVLYINEEPTDVFPTTLPILWYRKTSGSFRPS